MPTTTHTPTHKILALIHSIPCLHEKLHDYYPDRFDADAFHRLTGPWSSGEKLCAIFVLNVWNPNGANSKGWHFNLFDFIGTADWDNKQAIIEWMLNPIWP